jgi:hypothetical protein
MLQKFLQRLRRVRHVWEELRVQIMLARAGVRSRAATDEERSLLLRVPQLIAYGFDVHFDPAREVCMHRTFPNGAISIKYTYEAIDSPAGFLPLVLISRIEQERTAAEAAKEFQDGIAAYQAGAERVGGRFVFKGNLQSWCDNAYVAFTLAEPNDTIVGCLLSFQRGRMVYSIVLRGIVLDNEEDIEGLLYPVLERGSRWADAAA